MTRRRPNVDLAADGLAAPTAATIMTTPVICVDAAMPLNAVWQVMRRHGVLRVVVLDGGAPLGIVDQLDVLAAWGAAQSEPRAVLTAVTATPCLSPDSTLPAVCRAVLQAHHEAVMVLDDHGDLRGVVSLEDVLRTLSAESHAGPG